jgi:hypothetical protein
LSFFLPRGPPNGALHEQTDEGSVPQQHEKNTGRESKKKAEVVVGGSLVRILW